MAYDLNPDEVIAYGTRRRNALQTWGNQTNQIDYNSNAADQDYADTYKNTTRQWDQGRTRVPGAFARRGLSTSGIYGQGLNDFNTTRNEAFGQLSRQYYNQKANYGMQRDAANQNYWMSMDDIDQQERARRAQIAASLQGIA